MNQLSKYSEVAQPCAPIRQTLRERLVEQKRYVVENLANINSALEFMDKNPDFENFHNIIGKAGF